MQEKQIYIADNIHKTISMSKIEKSIISTILFNRLHDIFQNSTTYLTFPSNRHNRFEHSLGVMKLSGDMFYHAISNTDKDTIEKLFCNINNSMNKVISDILSDNATYSNYLGDRNLQKSILEKKEIKFNNVFYNTVIPRNIDDENEYYYLVIYEAVRLAGLLHDVGHPPFSHITEGALNKLYDDISSKTNLTKREENFKEILEAYYIDDIQLHENIGNRMVNWIFRTYMRENSHEKFEEKKFYAFVFKAVENILLEKDNTWKSLHRIIDNSIDSDRLDYVSRDLLNSGINQGIIEYSRLIPSMKILIKDDVFLLISDLKTLGTIEDFFTKRWYLYNNIIFHHRVIKTDTLLEECIIGIAKDYLLKEEEEEYDDNKSTLPYNISGLWYALDVTEGSDLKKFNLLIQWNDSWLMTILKKHFFDEYQMLEEEKDNKEKLLLRNKLEELLANKKYFYSIIKTYSDIKFLDNIVLKKLKDKYNTEDEIIRAINEEVIVDTEGNIIREVNETSIDYEDHLWESIKNKSESKLFIIKLDEYLKVFDGINVRSDILSWTNEFFQNQKYENKIRDFILKTKSAKPGVNPEPMLYKDDKIVELRDVSMIENNILDNIEVFPFMYIYIDSNNNKLDEKNILKELGEFLGNKIDETYLYKVRG